MPKLLSIFAVLLATPSFVQAQRVQSPQLHSDGTVTFRFLSEEADEVTVKIARVENGTIECEPIRPGFWQGTSSPLPPGIYEYNFVVDGVEQVDPRNRWIKKWYTLNSLFEVLGDPPRVTELQTVPHGVLHHHVYTSDAPEQPRSVVVYTPPGYFENPSRKYPTLYLLHGFGDDQTAWTEVGRAHRIADNLIASGQAKEMLIVMPYGHPTGLPYNQVPEGYGSQNDAAMVRDLDDTLIPWVQQHYRAASEKENRAIAGLSMGGGHSIRTALATNDFAWVGAFSAAAPENAKLTELAKDLGQFKSQLELFWIACGEDDFLLQRNRDFVQQLKQAGVPHQYVESPGGHNWSVWRDDYLPKFLPMLFQSH